jgi:hypothetical protein
MEELVVYMILSESGAVGGITSELVFVLAVLDNGAAPVLLTALTL